jgi:NAD(P)-dependent dehydrogenase (short-subunit alcohol dehydrogenase family)
MAASFANKVITITGGAQGIGFATARYVAQRGATVCIADILKHELEKAARRLRTEFKEVKARVDYVDVGNFSQVKEWIESVKHERGKIDECLNGAGTQQQFSMLRSSVLKSKQAFLARSARKSWTMRRKTSTQ